MNKKSILILISALFFSHASFANQFNKPNAAYDQLAEQLAKQLQASMKVMNDPKIIKANAKYIKSLYDALIAEGFTKEQALQLVAASLTSKK